MDPRAMEAAALDNVADNFGGTAPLRDVAPQGTRRNQAPCLRVRQRCEHPQVRLSTYRQSSISVPRNPDQVVERSFPSKVPSSPRRTAGVVRSRSSPPSAPTSGVVRSRSSPPIAPEDTGYPDTDDATGRYWQDVLNNNIVALRNEERRLIEERIAALVKHADGGSAEVASLETHAPHKSEESTPAAPQALHQSREEQSQHVEPVLPEASYAEISRAVKHAAVRTRRANGRLAGKTQAAEARCRALQEGLRRTTAAASSVQSLPAQCTERRAPQLQRDTSDSANEMAEDRRRFAKEISKDIARALADVERLLQKRRLAEEAAGPKMTVNSGSLKVSFADPVKQ